MPDNVKNSLLKRALTLEDCIYWNQNKNKNPITKYPLKSDSKLLKEVEKICKEMLSKQEEKKEETLHISNQHYPDLNEQDFGSKIAELYEYYLYKVPEYDKIKSKEDYYNKSNELCGEFEKTLYQYFVSNYISTRTPYKSILLYHGVGVGKTCSAITLAETFLSSHNIEDEPKIWVIMPQALKQGFKEQIFNFFDNFEDLKNQCTGDLYVKLASVMRNSDRDKVKQNIKKLIKSRYRIFTYEMFASFIQTEYIDKNRNITDKVIIIDEAHNIRSNDNLDKKVYSALVHVAKEGMNNRFVLLSATPMYNKVDDILYLFYLLVLNDKRKNILEIPFPILFSDENVLNSDGEKLIKLLSSNYVSYLRGKNPFTFALKLSPKDFYNNVKYLTKEIKIDSNGKEIPAKFNNWLSNIDDSIVLCKLGKYQKEYLSNHINDTNILTNTQPMNIVYDGFNSEKGFNTFFTRTDSANTINVNYNKKYENALYPDDNHLGNVSGKMLNICNVIKNTEGVVVIYSNYIWSGVIPMAICLEHMGFNREGATNILKNPKIIPDAPKYNQKTSPKYCILSSDNSEVMGNTSIDKLIKKINSDTNIDGSQVKVILMTPVASEGLSFYNVREMHIMEPWFHFNKSTQVIGRGIRNCRHQLLPIEKRNVTVFMYASYENQEKETADIHALRIASVKFLEINTIDKLIRDNAVDCFLMKNLNYFPKSLFELGEMKITTSQNNTINYLLGDKENLKPTCKDVVPKKYSGMRKEAYKHFIPLVQNRIKKIIIENIQNNNWFIPNDNFLTIKFDKKIIYQAIDESVYPRTLIDGYILAPHNDGIHIIKIQNKDIKKIKLTQEVKKIEKAQNKCSMKEINQINKQPIEEAIVALYLSLDAECLIQIVKDIIEKDVDETLLFISKCLFKAGVLISKNEISTKNTNDYIGYVNIYNNDFEPILYIDGKYRNLTDKESNELISNRVLRTEIPNMEIETKPWGFIALPGKKGKKNIFKIFTPGKGNGIKTGRECSTLEKATQESLLLLMNNNTKGTKIENCNNLLKLLISSKRITMNPKYIPK